MKFKKQQTSLGGGPHCINHGVDILQPVQDFCPSTVRIFLAEGTFARRFDPQNMVVLSKNNDQMKGEMKFPGTLVICFLVHIGFIDTHKCSYA